MLSVPKFTPRVQGSKHYSINRWVSFLKKLEYTVQAHEDRKFICGQPIFTIVLTAYEDCSIDYLQKSIDSVLTQTYKNIELILISNGCKGSQFNKIYSTFLDNKNSKFISFEHNYYDPEANSFSDPIPAIWNSGLFASVGDFIYILSYDDFLSDNYVEEMVGLLRQHDGCLTSSAQLVPVDKNGVINTAYSKILNQKNQRRKYTNGLTLAMNFIKGGDLIYLPVAIFSINSNHLIEYGGYDSINDLSQLIKIGVHGVSAYSRNAQLFWRFHENQANRKQVERGLIYYDLFRNYSKNHKIYSMHLNTVGYDFAKEFQFYVNRLSEDLVLSAVTKNFLEKNYPLLLRNLKRVFKECPVGFQLKVYAHILKLALGK